MDNQSNLDTFEVIESDDVFDSNISEIDQLDQEQTVNDNRNIVGDSDYPNEGGEVIEQGRIEANNEIEFENASSNEESELRVQSFQSERAFKVDNTDKLIELIDQFRYHMNLFLSKYVNDTENYDQYQNPFFIQFNQIDELIDTVQLRWLMLANKNNIPANWLILAEIIDSREGLDNGSNNTDQEFTLTAKRVYSINQLLHDRIFIGSKESYYFKHHILIPISIFVLYQCIQKYGDEESTSQGMISSYNQNTSIMNLRTRSVASGHARKSRISYNPLFDIEFSNFKSDELQVIGISKDEIVRFTHLAFNILFSFKWLVSPLEESQELDNETQQSGVQQSENEQIENQRANVTKHNLVNIALNVNYMTDFSIKVADFIARNNLNSLNIIYTRDNFVGYLDILIQRHINSVEEQSVTIANTVKSLQNIYSAPESNSTVGDINITTATFESNIKVPKTFNVMMVFEKLSLNTEVVTAVMSTSDSKRRPLKIFKEGSKGLWFKDSTKLVPSTQNMRYKNAISFMVADEDFSVSLRKRRYRQVLVNFDEGTINTTVPVTYNGIENKRIPKQVRSLKEILKSTFDEFYNINLWIETTSDNGEVNNNSVTNYVIATDINSYYEINHLIYLARELIRTDVQNFSYLSGTIVKIYLLKKLLVVRNDVKQVFEPGDTDIDGTIFEKTFDSLLNNKILGQFEETSQDNDMQTLFDKIDYSTVSKQLAFGRDLPQHPLREIIGETVESEQESDSFFWYLISSIYLKIENIHSLFISNFYKVSNVRYRNINANMSIDNYNIDNDILYHFITNDFSISPFFTINESKQVANLQSGTKIRFLRAGYQIFHKRFKVSSVVININFSHFYGIERGHDITSDPQTIQDKGTMVFNIKVSGIEDIGESLTIRNFIQKVIDYINANKDEIKYFYQYLLGNDWKASMFSSETEKKRFNTQFKRQLQSKDNLSMLKKLKEDLFIPGYSNACQNKPGLLNSSSDEEASQFALRTGYEVLKYSFPVYHEEIKTRDVPTNNDIIDWKYVYLYCPHKNTPYPGVMFNNLPNSSKYPIVPCCYQASHTIPPRNRYIKSLLSQWLSGNQLLYWGGKKQLSNTPRVLEPKHEAFLPPQIQDWLHLVTGITPTKDVDKETFQSSGNRKIGDFVRIGVETGKSSLLRTLLISIGNIIDERYKDIDVNIYRRYLFESGKNIISDFDLSLKDKSEILSSGPGLLIPPVIENITETYPEVARQQLYDQTNDEIYESAVNHDQALDSRLHIRILEEHFGINIIVLTNLGIYGNNNGVSSLEVPRHSMFYIRNLRKDRYIVILYKHFGTQSDNLSHPHYEIVALKKYLSDIGEYQYSTINYSPDLIDNYQRALNVLLHNRVWLRNSYYRGFKVNEPTSNDKGLWSNFIIESIRGFSNHGFVNSIVSQAIDSIGFVRALNIFYEKTDVYEYQDAEYMKYSLITPPMETLNIPQVDSLDQVFIADNLSVINDILIPLFSEPIALSYSSMSSLSPSTQLVNVAGIYFSITGEYTDSELESIFCPVTDEIISNISQTYNLDIVASRLPIIKSVNKEQSNSETNIDNIHRILDSYNFNSNVDKYQYFKRQRIKLMAFLSYLYEVIAYDNMLGSFTLIKTRFQYAQQIVNSIRVVDENELKNLLIDSSSEASQLLYQEEPEKGYDAFDSIYSLYLYDLESIPSKIPSMNFQESMEWFSRTPEFKFVRFVNSQPTIIATSYHLKEAWVQYLVKFIKFGRRTGVIPRDTLNIGYFGKPYESGSQRPISKVVANKYQDTEFFESQSQLIQWKEMKKNISRRYLVSSAIHLRYLLTTETAIFYWKELDRYFLIQSINTNSGNEGLRRCLLVSLYWYYYKISLGDTIDKVLDKFYNHNLRRTLHKDIIKKWSNSKGNNSNIESSVVDLALNFRIFDPDYYNISVPGVHKNEMLSYNIHGVTVQYVPDIHQEDHSIKIITADNFFASMLELNETEDIQNYQTNNESIISDQNQSSQTQEEE